MIKCETLGMFENAKNNPVIVLEEDVDNYSFIEVDGITYLVSNVGSGDFAYGYEDKIPAGNFVNGFDLSAWINQKLVVDGKHVTGGLEDVEVGTVLVIGEDGKLEVGTADSGYTFTVTDINIGLTEKAVKVVIGVAEADPETI